MLRNESSSEPQLEAFSLYRKSWPICSQMLMRLDVTFTQMLYKRIRTEETMLILPQYF